MIKIHVIIHLIYVKLDVRSSCPEIAPSSCYPELQRKCCHGNGSVVMVTVV
jgi:hypothetical protein